MRTVSFSSPAVRKMLQNDFVCQLINTTGDPTSGSSVGHAPRDTPGICTRGIGKQNVQCLFMTPGGEIFHAASGFRSPEDLRSELEFSLALYRSIRKKPADSEQLVREAHIQRLRKQGFGDDVITRSDPTGMLTTMHTMRDFAGLNRSTGNPLNAMQNVFAIKGRGSELSDGRFSVHYPMMPMEEFLENPRVLVGHEASAFQSVGNGGASGGRIGR